METCALCGEPIDPAKEAYITDADGKVYHEECYRQLRTEERETPKKRGKKGGE